MFCASDAYNDAKGTCSGDSGAPLMIGIRDMKTFKTKTTLVGILHGGLVNCDNSDFPAIYTRTTEPEIWKWLMKEFINKGKQRRFRKKP